MSILSSELKLYKSEIVNETTANGGRMSSNQVVSGVSKNLWPSVSKADRTDGLITYRKAFEKNASAENLTLLNPQIWLDIVTPAGDAVGFFPGTQRDVFSDVSASLESKTWYGCSLLKTNVSAGASSFVVVVEVAQFASPYPIFHVGSKLRITDKVLATSIPGNEEEFVIDSVSVSGLEITIGLGAYSLSNSYTAADARVMSIYEPADIACSLDSFVVTSAAGDLDDAQITLNNIGTIEQDWIIQFTSATGFNLFDENMTVVAAGTVSSNFTPLHPVYGVPYFTIPSVAFSGTFVTGNSIVFTTHPAAVPIWECRIIPSNTDSLTGNKTTVVLSGESE